MSEPTTWRPSYPFLALCIVLLAAAVFLVGSALIYGARGIAQPVNGPAAVGPGLPAASAMPREARPLAPVSSPSVLQPPAGTRHLAEYYERRAYPGAPPQIPHAVDENLDIGVNCVSCHLTGGFAARFEAFAPTAPHPEYLNCRQCHTPQRTVGRALAASRWQKIAGPRLGQAALPGGPPPIPHGLQLRENCVACHSGAGAVSAIATRHPERGNCRQCHVPSTDVGPWSRP